MDEKSKKMLSQSSEDYLVIPASMISGVDVSIEPSEWVCGASRAKVELIITSVEELHEMVDAVALLTKKSEDD